MKDMVIFSQDFGPFPSGYAAPNCALDTAPDWSTFLGEQDFPLWCAKAQLPSGAVLSWANERGDQAIYVVEGALSYNGQVCPRGGAIVSPSAAECAPMAAIERTKVVHFGTFIDHPSGPSSADDVRLFDSEGVSFQRDERRIRKYFCDGSDEACDIALFETGRFEEFPVSPHSHSVDEIIFVLNGELHLGSYTVAKDGALGVTRGRRYGFRTGPEGFHFLNFRKGQSTFTDERGTWEESVVPRAQPLQT